MKKLILSLIITSGCFLFSCEKKVKTENSEEVTTGIDGDSLAETGEVPLENDTEVDAAETPGTNPGTSTSENGLSTDVGKPVSKKIPIDSLKDDR